MHTQIGCVALLAVGACAQASGAALGREFYAQALDEARAHVCAVVEFAPTQPVIEWRATADTAKVVARLDARGLWQGDRLICEREGKALLRAAGSADAPQRCDTFVRAGAGDRGLGPLSLCVEADESRDGRVWTTIAGTPAIIELPKGPWGEWRFRVSERARIAGTRERSKEVLGSAAFQRFVADLDACAQADDPKPCFVALSHGGPQPDAPRAVLFEDWQRDEAARWPAAELVDVLRRCVAAFRVGGVHAEGAVLEAETDDFAICLALRTNEGWRFGGVGAGE